MKVFRPLNIVIVALVGLVFWRITDMMLTSSIANATFLNSVYILTSCLVAGAAYLINDYYDKDIDAINHPKKIFPFSKSTTWLIYSLLNLIALGLGVFAFSPEFTIIFLLLPIWGLWFYSFILKRVAIIGNFTVAMLAIWLPIGVVLLNIPNFHLTGQESITGSGFVQFGKYKSLIFLLISCSFLTTFSREIVKDIQDEKGDRAMNGKTFPILVGKDFALICAAGLLIVSSLIWGNFTFKNFESMGYASVPFILTLVLLVLGVFVMFSGRDWSKRTKWSSLVIKLAMVSALVSGGLF